MNEKLLQYNREGLIPGPGESEEAFLQRAAYGYALESFLAEKLAKEMPGLNVKLTPELIQEVAPLLKRLFDCVPVWVPIVFSNQKMAFWHGGSAWIFQLEDNTPTSAFFQLRETFAKSKHYLGIYSRDEILAHESAHVGRMVFDEPKFEEILAYRTSTSGFRRFFGPIVQAPWESLLFLFALFLCFFADLLITVTDYPDPNHISLWIKMFPLLLLIYGLGRVFVRQHQFSRCLKALQFLGLEKANAVIYRLRDDEIMRFGSMSEQDIRKYASEQAPQELRWQVIQQAYLQQKK